MKVLIGPRRHDAAFVSHLRDIVLSNEAGPAFRAAIDIDPSDPEVVRPSSVSDKQVVSLPQLSPIVHPMDAGHAVPE